MVYSWLVVQWEGENSVSTVCESQVILGAEHAITEGLRVQVSTGKTSKGRMAVYYATVLKVFGKFVE